MAKKKRKVYEVSVKAFKVFVVDAESEQEAMKLAVDECGMDWEVDQAYIEGELKTADDVARSIRHGAEDMREFK